MITCQSHGNSALVKKFRLLMHDSMIFGQVTDDNFFSEGFAYVYDFHRHIGLTTSEYI